MVCSKILPELLDEILQYFHQDHKTLNSCILVNKLWCLLAIPLLWENPFSIVYPKNYYFIDIYLYNLNDDDKTKLIEYGINKDTFPSNTLFKYPSFIKHLDIDRISNSIVKWEVIAKTSTTNKAQQSNYLQTSNFMDLIFRSLILIFIENGVNLRSLNISSDDSLEIILQNPNFIGSIKYLKLSDLEISEFSTKLLMILNSKCNQISSLYQSYCMSDDYDNHQMMEKSLSQIINSQKSLRKVLFSLNGFPLYHSLLSLKNSHCSNTLNTIIFHRIVFKNIIVLNEALNQLNVLESIHIIYCRSLDTKFVQQIINISKPFKLKSLFLDRISQFEPLDILLQQFGNNLENFGIYVNDKPQFSQFFKPVTRYCSKIKFLCLDLELIYQNIKSALNLIENIKQSINCLLITVNKFDNIFCSIILQNLGQILPFKFDFLKLSLSFYESDFEIFLYNSQNTFIETLSIVSRKYEKYCLNYSIPCIKEYIIKMKRVKFLAILEISQKQNLDWFSQKSIVKEFKLYDIQIVV